MTDYSHDRIVPFKDSDLGKKKQIAEMFDRIAFRYDFLNRFLSGGIDLYWRRRAIRELQGTSRTVDHMAGRGAGTRDGQPISVLDVATGTGDMAILLTRHLPGVRVTGVDISKGMLDIGREKVHRLRLGKQITLQMGDSEALEFTDDHFDAMTVAFGVRNFENLEKGLKEMFRVLRPGGRLVILEFSQPRTPGIRQLYDLYLRLVAPHVGKMVSSNREAYQYLNDSVKAFPEGTNFLQILDGCGYVHPRLRPLSLGICSLYIAEKPLD
ncbi:MAG TPA: bifunctional demethylmenaquinone methyltransferase/2-methoxy-6-polyprenyl-1,4-benzoquinol methylase UbiE [Puia sp.]|nr:bifunctional demethylmenaquinone methyltransferase/2-methoxy-6-polyprenyl-1,4-benzoquinol methylase UbiE [Puia sp.]